MNWQIKPIQYKHDKNESECNKEVPERKASGAEMCEKPQCYKLKIHVHETLDL